MTWAGHIFVKCCALPFIIVGEIMFHVADFILSCLPEDERNWPG